MFWPYGNGVVTVFRNIAPLPNFRIATQGIDHVFLELFRCHLFHKMVGGAGLEPATFGLLEDTVNHWPDALTPELPAVVLSLHMEPPSHVGLLTHPMLVTLPLPVYDQYGSRISWRYPSYSYGKFMTFPHIPR